MAAKKEATVPPDRDSATEARSSQPPADAGAPANDTGAPAEQAPAPVEHVRTLTAQAFMLSIGKHADPIGKAFLSGELRKNRLRKLPASEWQELYSKFLSAER